MSSVCAKYLSWKTHEDSYNYYGYYIPIPNKMAVSALQLIKIDTLSLLIRKKLVAIEFQSYFIGWRSMLVKSTSKLPFYVIMQAIEITKTPFFNMSHSLIHSSKFHENAEKIEREVSYVLEVEHLELFLSQHQKECLFYFFRDKTTKHIARLLGANHRATKFHIFHIKSNLKCNMKNQLIEKACESEFIFIISHSLITLIKNKKGDNNECYTREH